MNYKALRIKAEISCFKTKNPFDNCHLFLSFKLNILTFFFIKTKLFNKTQFSGYVEKDQSQPSIVETFARDGNNLELRPRIVPVHPRAENNESEQLRKQQQQRRLQQHGQEQERDSAAAASPRLRRLSQEHESPLQGVCEASQGGRSHHRDSAWYHHSRPGG